MKPRITLNMTAGGELEIWVNETGRDRLVQELQALNERNDHFHLGWFEVEVSARAYRPTDTIIEYGKVLFRTDEWDRRFFPHVLDESN
jgi:hypothetical protein